MDIIKEFRKLVGAWVFLSGEGLRLREDEQAVVQLWTQIKDELKVTSSYHKWNNSHFATLGTVNLIARNDEVRVTIERRDFAKYRIEITVGPDKAYQGPRESSSLDFKRFVAAAFKWALALAIKDERADDAEVENKKVEKPSRQLGESCTVKKEQISV